LKNNYETVSESKDISKIQSFIGYAAQGKLWYGSIFKNIK
jgi:hypothetical protein